MSLNFNFSEENVMLVDALGEAMKPWTNERKAELHDMVDNSVFPEEIWQTFADVGLLGCLVPEQYGGSFTNIRGGHNYPYLLRTTPTKPLRVLLQSGENDAGTLFGDWPLANRTMATAFSYAGYDHHFEFGTGGHSLRHGGAVFADSIRWLWRDEKEATDQQ